MTLLTLFLEFFKVGLFCFGGAFGMIPLIEETVLYHGWLTQSQFYDFIGVCESTPGPIAVNMATYVGSTQAGLLGSIAATLGVVMPSFLIIVAIAAILKNFTKNKYFKGFLKGVKPVIVALILSTGATLFVRSATSWISLVIFGLLVLIYFGYKRIFRKKLSSVALILISAVLGIGVSMLAELL